MAKKRTAKKKAPTKRRSISGTGSYTNALMMVGGTIVGNVGSRMLASNVGKNLQPQIIAMAEIGVGTWLAVSSNGNFMTGVGLGMAGEGATFFLTKTGVIKGVDDYYDAYDDGMSGTESVAVNSGSYQNYAALPEISGW